MKNGVQLGPNSLLGDHGELRQHIENIPIIQSNWEDLCTQKHRSYSVTVFDGFDSWIGVPSSALRVQNVYNSKVVSKFTQILQEKAFEEASLGNFVLTLGGDHSLAMGTTSGLLRYYPDLAVIWIDAHPVKISSAF